MILTWTAGELGEESSLEYIEKLLNHDNEDMRKVATVAIRKIQSKLDKYSKNNSNINSSDTDKKIDLNEKKSYKDSEKNIDELQSFLGLDKNQRLDFLDRLKPGKNDIL